MDEYWAEIEGFPNYVISNMGHISNIKHRRELKPRSNGLGYMKVMLHHRGQVVDLYLHRLVAKYFLGGFREGLQVTHHNGDKTDCAVHNLRLRGRLPPDETFDEEIVRPTRGQVRIVETGQIFPNVRACAQYIGGDYGSIYAVLRGERRQHRGYTYEFLEDR